MTKMKGLAITMALAALIVLGVACSNGEASTGAESPATSAPPTSVQPTESAPALLPAVAPGEAVPVVGAPGLVAPGGSTASGKQAPDTVNLEAAPNEPATASAPPIVAPAPVSAPPVAVVEPEPSLVSANGVSRGVPEPSFAPVSGVLTAVSAPLLQTGSSQAGIWVTGQGTITLEPDLALVNIGVETEAETLAEARDLAATAMAAIVDAVKAYGLTDVDIQTRSFNIYPVYEYPEVVELGRTTRKQVLTGYRVSNSASIKVRDLDVVGNIIDDVATAGGDATRINGISFTVEDPKPFMSGLREEAVKDAIGKAQQFADLTGVALGRPFYITESGGRIAAQDFATAESFALKAAPATSISGGELEISASVQVAFGIE